MNIVSGTDFLTPSLSGLISPFVVKVEIRFIGVSILFLKVNPINVFQTQVTYLKLQDTPPHFPRTSLRRRIPIQLTLLKPWTSNHSLHSNS